MNPSAINQEKLEGWNRPPIVEPDGEAELLEVAMGPHHPQRTVSFAWTWRWTVSASFG